MPRPRTTLVALIALTAGALGAGGPASATPADPVPEKRSLAVGTGGRSPPSTPTRPGWAWRFWPRPPRWA